MEKIYSSHFVSIMELKKIEDYNLNEIADERMDDGSDLISVNIDEL